MDRLKDKVAVVTGAGSGIGRASSTLFARHGAKIIVADIDKGKGETVAESIRSQAGDALAVEVDVGDSASVQAMVTQAENHFGGIDLLFTNALNAGLVNNSDTCALELEESVFDEIHRVALRGVFLCAKYVGAAMERRGGGAMLFTATVDAQIGCANLDAYTAAKGGVIALTRSLAAGVASRNIRVNAISPGFVNTEPQANFMNDPDARAQIESLHLLPVPDPEEVAPLAMFLLSDEARSITGSVHQVDAGYLAFKSHSIDIMEVVRTKTPTAQLGESQ
jgi:NAD(P)-dependent dehydrogenase (short-subunit alcohol dehydrogenase family)